MNKNLDNFKTIHEQNANFKEGKGIQFKNNTIRETNYHNDQQNNNIAFSELKYKINKQTHENQ